MVYRYILITTLFISSLFASINVEELKSFKADFVQRVTNESNKTIEYNGKVFIKNSGKVLWQYQTPIVKNVFVLGDLVIVDEPELEQAIYTNLEKSIDMIKLLKDAKKVEENLYKSTLYEIDYFITLENEKIKSLNYMDQLANKVSIDFFKIEQNIQFSDDIFKFIPPKEYDIIEK